MNKLIVVLIFSLAVSCGGDETALKEVNLAVKEENKEWLTSDSYGTNFIMRDNFGISQSFSMTANSSGFSTSTSSYFGVNTKKTNTESYNQGYSSSFGLYFSMLITAGFDDIGDNISVRLGEFSYNYDFKYKTIVSIYTPYGNKSKTYTSEGLEDNETIYSTATIIDTLTIDGILYNDLLHIKLEDFRDKWQQFTVTDIYIAKHVGLVKYQMNNKVLSSRI